MKKSIKKGIGFGLTSGIITTLGLIVGLSYGTSSKLLVIGGILMIAVADSFSDALGIHVSEEFEGHKQKEIWESSIHTFLSKLVFALTFIIPFLIFTLNTAIIISIAWGLALISLFSFYIARKQNKKPFKVVTEHLIISIIVIIITYFIGKWVSTIFI